MQFDDQRLKKMFVGRIDGEVNEIILQMLKLRNKEVTATKGLLDSVRSNINPLLKHQKLKPRNDRTYLSVKYL